MNTTQLPQVFDFISDNNSFQVNEWYSCAMQCLANSNNSPYASREAKRWLLKAGLNGHAQSAFMLGSLYALEGNDKRAFRWYRQAALRGHYEAITLVIKAYDEGIGVDADANMGLYWSLKMSDKFPGERSNKGFYQRSA